MRENNHGAALMEQFKHAQALSAYEKVTDKAPGWAPASPTWGWRRSTRMIMSAPAALRRGAASRSAPAAGGVWIRASAQERGEERRGDRPLEAARGIDPKIRTSCTTSACCKRASAPSPSPCRS